MTEAVVVRPPEGFELGDPVAGEPTRTAITCQVTVAPGGGGGGKELSGGVEYSDRGRDGILEQLTVYLSDSTVDIVHTDLLELDEVLYEIDAAPARWSNPYGGPGGLVVQVSRGVG